MSLPIESRPNSFPNASWHDGFGHDSISPQAQQVFECLIQDPEDGRVSRKDLEAFIADIAEKRDNPDADDPYYQWEDDVLTYAVDLSSAWNDLGFGHTVGAEDIERLAGAAEAADVVKTGWWDDVVEHGGLSSKREQELDTAGPNNDEDAYADGVFSLRDFNAYIENNRQIVEV